MSQVAEWAPCHLRTPFLHPIRGKHRACGFPDFPQGSSMPKPLITRTLKELPLSPTSLKDPPCRAPGVPALMSDMHRRPPGSGPWRWMWLSCNTSTGCVAILLLHQHGSILMRCTLTQRMPLTPGWPASQVCGLQGFPYHAAEILMALHVHQLKGCRGS